MLKFSSRQQMTIALDEDSTDKQKQKQKRKQKRWQTKTPRCDSKSPSKGRSHLSVVTFILVQL